MPALRRSPAPRVSAAATPKARKQRQDAETAVTAERVREMLLEIAFVLHATRVVRKLEEGAAEG